MTILLMDQQIEKLARSRTRITTWIRGADEHLLRCICKSVEEERAPARKYRRQIRRCLHHPRIIVRIHLDDALGGDLHNPLPKIREIRNDLVNLDRSLRLDDLRHLLRPRRNTILLRQLRCHPLELRQLSIKILETLRLQFSRRLGIIPETLQRLRIDPFPTYIRPLLLDDLVDLVKTLVLETLNPENRCKLPRHLRKIIQTLLQLLILRLLLDGPDNLLETIATYQREKTETRRPASASSFHSSRLNRSDTVASQSLHVTLDNTFLDHVAKVRVQHRLRNHMRLRKTKPSGK